MIRFESQKGFSRSLILNFIAQTKTLRAGVIMCPSRIHRASWGHSDIWCPASWPTNQSPLPCPCAPLFPLIPHRKGAVVYPSLLHLPMDVYMHRCTHIHNDCLAIHLNLVLHFQIFHSLLGSVNNTLYKHRERIIQERLNPATCGNEDLIELQMTETQKNRGLNTGGKGKVRAMIQCFLNSSWDLVPLQAHPWWASYVFMNQHG